jgi:hypothetical protein
MTTQTYHKGLPSERSFCGTPARPVRWEHDGDEWIASCDDPHAAGELCGFGATPAEAIQDLEHEVGRTVEFATECESEWWAATYR